MVQVSDSFMPEFFFTLLMVESGVFYNSIFISNYRVYLGWITSYPPFNKKETKYWSSNNYNL